MKRWVGGWDVPHDGLGVLAPPGFVQVVEEVLARHQLLAQSVVGWVGEWVV